MSPLHWTVFSSPSTAIFSVSLFQMLCLGSQPMAPSPILDFPSQSSPLNKTVLILRGLAQTAPEEPVLASCTPAGVPLVSESPCSIETLWLKCSVSYLLGVMKWRLGWFISPGRSGSMWKQMTSVHFHQAKVQFAHKEWCVNNKWDWTLHFRSRSSENVLKSFPGTLKVEGTHGWCLKNTLALKNTTQPWLVWLNGLSASLQTKKLLVQFPVRAHAWVAGQVPTWGRVKDNW